MFLAGTDANTIVSKHIIVNMLELLILNALDNSSIGNDAKFIRFMVFKTTDRVKLTDLPI